MAKQSQPVEASAIESVRLMIPGMTVSPIFRIGQANADPCLMGVAAKTYVLLSVEVNGQLVRMEFQDTERGNFILQVHASAAIVRYRRSLAGTPLTEGEIATAIEWLYRRELGLDLTGDAEAKLVVLEQRATNAGQYASFEARLKARAKLDKDSAAEAVAIETQASTDIVDPDGGDDDLERPSADFVEAETAVT